MTETVHQCPRNPDGYPAALPQAGVLQEYVPTSHLSTFQNAQDHNSIENRDMDSNNAHPRKKSYMQTAARAPCTTSADTSSAGGSGRSGKGAHGCLTGGSPAIRRPEFMACANVLQYNHRCDHYIDIDRWMDE